MALESDMAAWDDVSILLQSGLIHLLLCFVLAAAAVLRLLIHLMR